MFRAPYHPIDGPIEYVFNTLQCTLTLAMYRIETLDDLEAEFYAVLGSIVDFVNYFIHCGFYINKACTFTCT